MRKTFLNAQSWMVIAISFSIAPSAIAEVRSHRSSELSQVKLRSTGEMRVSDFNDGRGLVCERQARLKAEQAAAAAEQAPRSSESGAGRAL